MRQPKSDQLIAIVEDDSELRSMLTDYLSSSGFAVVEYSNPLLFLEDFANRLPEISAIISDVNMPGMNGFDFLRKIESKGPKIAFVLMSALPQSKSELKSVSRKFDVFLRKPFRLDDLKDYLEKAIVRQDLAPAASAN